MFTRRFATWPRLATPIIAALLALLIGASPALATKVFLPSSGSWHSPGSWSDGVVPGPDDDVFIGAGKTAFVSAPASTRNLHVDSGAAVRVASPGLLTLHGPTQTVHGSIHLNVPGGPITPGAELRFAADAEIAGFGSIFMNQIGAGSRVAVDTDRRVTSNILIAGVGQLHGRFENRGVIRATGAALSLDAADIFNVRIIEAVGPTAVVSFSFGELEQGPEGRLRTALDGDLIFTVVVIRGGHIESDGSPSAEVACSSTSPLRTTFEDVTITEQVQFRVIVHSSLDFRRGSFAGRLLADSHSETGFWDVVIPRTANLGFAPECTVYLTDVDLAGTVVFGRANTVQFTRTLVASGGSCTSLDSDIFLTDVKCCGTMLWDSCRVAAAGQVEACDPGTVFTVTGDTPVSVFQCEPGTEMVVRDDALVNVEKCSVALRGTWTSEDGGQTRLDQCTVESEDGYQWFAHRRGAFTYVNSTMTGEGQFWTITEDGRLHVHATTIAAALGVDEKDLEFDVQNATFESLNAFLRAKGLIFSGTGATIDLINTEVDSVDGSFTFVNSLVNADGFYAPNVDFQVSGQHGAGFLNGAASAVRSIAVRDQAQASVGGNWYIDDLSIDAVSAAAIDGAISWRGSFRSDADPANIVFGPDAALVAAGGEAGVTHLFGWLLNESRTTSFPAGRIPNLYVAPFTTLVLQPNEGRAVYVLNTVLDADAVLNNHNCVPVYIESVQADPTAEVINCSTTTPDREQIALDFQALGDALEEELPLEDMTGPNDQANANRRAQIAQKLRLIAASIRAEEDEEAATQIADVIKKVDPAQDPKWLRDTEATNLVLLTLTLLEEQFQALGE